MGFNLISIVFLVVCTALNTKAHIEHDTRNPNYTLVTHLANPTTLELILTVKTTGWIGIGVSNTPSMVKADLAIITEISATEAKVEDFHDLVNERPVPDNKTVSDWESMSYARNATTGTRRVVIHRLLKTTDPNDGQDLEITENPMYLVWAYGATDELEVHVARGSIPAKVNLITPEGPDPNPTTTEDPNPTTTEDPNPTTTPDPSSASDLKDPVAFVLATLLLALVKFI